MRRIALVVAVLMSFVLGGVVAKSATSGTPEIDKANATIDLHSQHPLSRVTCVGEDTIGYITLKGMWSGIETEVTPGFTDYSLTGPVTISAVVWTINTSTTRGVLTAKITLVGSTGTPVYKGKLTVITEGIPTAGAGGAIGRGAITAAMVPPDEAVTPGDDTLYANVEMGISPDTMSAKLVFGDAAPFMGTPNFSVVTNLLPPLDGTC